MSANPVSFSSAQLEKYKDVPALSPPPGIVPDFTARNQRADVYNILCSILLGIVYVFVFLRMYAKVWIKRSPGFDDVACVLATIGLSACFGFAVAMSLHGVGKHQWDVPLSEIPFILQFGRYTSITLPPTMLSLKLSLLLLYLRIFAPDKVTRYLIYVGMTLCFLAYTVLMFLNIFSDVETVIDTNKALGAVNLFSDIYILCVPTTAISKLQLSVRKKIGVMLVFMTGIMYVLALLVAKEEVNLLTSPQRLCNEYAGTFLVTTIEEEVGLMCACMPFFPAIVKNSPTLQKCIHSVQSLGSWTLRSSRHTSAMDVRRSYQKQYSREGSLEAGLELEKSENFTEVALPESPKKTPRMEPGAFGEG
ncbi:MAG: hypothetical protein ASARMPRED_004042 [Alectoria sarmentosa]|nr:MAG: hypothetical protein ASARMPRED_004042 [Alectoria sarmentosa]